MRIQSLSQEDIQQYEKTYKDIYQLYTTETMTLKAIGDLIRSYETTYLADN
jgi:hypothetical protein